MVGVAVLGSIVNGQLTVNLVQQAHRHRHPQVVPVPRRLRRHHRHVPGRGQGGHGQEPAITHIVNEVVSAAYGAFGRGLNISLNIAGAPFWRRPSWP